MSESDIVSGAVAQPIRESIDDLLDGLENKVAELPGGLKKSLASAALATLRKVFAIPDDIGGDED